MENVPTSQLIFTGISLVFLLLGLTLIVTVIMFANPYDTIAHANVEKLRAAMDQACLSGNPVPINFQLQQNNPSRFSGFFTFIPIWITTIYGDPKYTLYYEAFPPGEGTGWEIYHIMQNRLLSPLPENFRGGSAQINEHMLKTEEHWKRSGTGKLEGIIVNNIILGGNKPVLAGENPDVRRAVSGGGTSASSVEEETFGKWKDAKDLLGVIPKEGVNNEFVFKNYRGLNSFEKTAVKYMPCGENTLCLKTPTGVFSYPLRHCKNIKAVQLLYDASGNQEAALNKMGFTELVAGSAGRSYFGAAKIAKFMLRHTFIAGLSTFLFLKQLREGLVYLVDVKVGDFAVVSPCKIKDAKIKVGKCNKFEFDRSGYMDTAFNPCTRVITYPIYHYDSGGTLQRSPNDEHTACAEKIGEEIYDNDNLGTYGDSDMCLQVSAATTEGYCWSKEPYKEVNVKGAFFSNAQWVSVIATPFGFTPIRKNTALLDGSKTEKEIVVLSPTQVALQQGRDLWDALDRKWWWGWPG